MAKRIILASGSRDRNRLLTAIGLNFEVIPSDFKEDESTSGDPVKIVAHNARGKAETIAEQLRGKGADALVIGADTVVAFQGQIIGKARHQFEAFQILEKLAGQTHQLLTGCCVIDVQSQSDIEFVDTTDVTFAPLSARDIWHYLEFNDEYRGRAGAYSLQDRASLFITNITGSPTNVIGLSISKLHDTLLRFGVNLLAGDFCTK
jgi:septum formation protein